VSSIQHRQLKRQKKGHTFEKRQNLPVYKF
jgi:hypothetical protein